MALPASPIEKVIKLDGSSLFDYFCDNARYVPDSPPGRGFSYAVRFGSQTLYSDDTHELFGKLKARVTAERRMATMKTKRKPRGVK